MGLTTLTQAERVNLAHCRPLQLVTLSLPGSVTLYLSDINYRYVYGASEILYEAYIHDISGIGAVVETDGGANTEVRIRVKNKQWGSHSYLIRLNDSNAFTRASVTIHELRIFTATETFASDVRTTLCNLAVERIEDVSAEFFTLVCSGRLYNLRNSLGLDKITAARYPSADPNEIGKYRNIVYGNVEYVPARLVRTGAIDTLAANITKDQNTIVVSGIYQIEFQATGTIQIDDEKIKYTGWNASTRTFSGCSRGFDGTTRTTHIAGAAVYQVLIQYWYEVAKHPVKSIDKVFVDNVRQTSGFTAYTGQEGDEATGFAGRAMVKFTTKPVIRKQVNIEVSREHGHGTNEGSHAHRSTSISTYQKSGVSASGGSQVENATNAIDGNGESYCNMFYAAPGQINLGLLSVTLEGGDYGEMVKIEAVATVYRSSCGCRIRYGAITWDIPAGAGGGDFRFTNPGARTWNEPVIFEMINRQSDTAWIHVHEISMIYYYYPRISNSPASGVSTSVSTETILGGLTTADVVIGDEICCDVRGYQDDGSGTYTGTANALIQRPDHVFKHMLVALLKQSAADIGTTLAASGAVYAAKTYRLAFLVHDIGTDGQQIFHALAAQCRSIFYEWGGKFELQVLPDSAPESSFTVEARDIIEQPTFNFSGSDQIRNRISAFYRRDYRGSRGRGNSLQAAVNPDALARGYMDVLETFQTPGDLQEDLLLSAVRLSGMAQSVMDYRLARRMRATMDVELRLKWRAMSTSPGSYFAYDDPMFGSSIYRVVEFRPDRSRGSIFVMGRAGESAVVQGGLITFTAPDLQIIYNDALVIADGLMTMAGESPKIFLGYPIQDGTLTLSNDAIAIAQNHNLVVQDGTLSFNDPYISFGEYAWEISSTELVPSDAASPIGAWEVSAGNLIPIDTPDFDDLWEVSGGNFIPKS